MDIERELGIKPTSDKREIRRAYARRLKETHPEDDPEGFQRLRQAYEAAMRQADWIAEEEAEEDPGGEEAEEESGAGEEDRSGPGAPTRGAGTATEDESGEAKPNPDRQALNAMVGRLAGLLDDGEDAGAAAALEAALGDPLLLNLKHRRVFELLVLETLGEYDPPPPISAKAAIAAFRWDEHWTDLPYDFQHLADRLLSVPLTEERLAELRRDAERIIWFSARPPWLAARLLLGRYRPIRFTLSGGPEMLDAMGNLLRELRAEHPSILENEVDPRVLAWWTEATESPQSRIARRNRYVTWTIIAVSFLIGLTQVLLKHS